MRSRSVPVLLASCALTACSTGSAEPRGGGDSAGASPADSAPVVSAAAASDVPAGDLLPTHRGVGRSQTWPVRVDAASTLFFRCTSGEGAVVHYGTGSQPCPKEGALLGIDLSPVRMEVRVDGPPAVKWAVSVSRNVSVPTGG